MGTSFKSQTVYNPGQSVFLATPSYESVTAGYAYSLALTTAELTRHNITFQLGIMHGNCHVDDGRNSLVRDFLEGNCTDMLFLDSDVMWRAQDVIRILSHNEDLVCGAYPLKCSPQRYPIGRIFHTRPNGMLEVSYAPTGFMRIKRQLLEKLWPLQSRHGKERPTAIFFERKFNDASRDGGDVTFCRKVIASGGKVVVDPTFVFSHIGEARYTGSFINYLAKDENRAKHFADCKDPLIDTPVTYGQACEITEVEKSDFDSDKPLLYWMDLLKRGAVSPALFEGLADVYGNKPWAATWDFQMIAYKMAMNLPKDATILETGCGLSTLVLAATGRKVVSIEEHGEHAEKVDKLLALCGLKARILVAPIKDGWHVVPREYWHEKADMFVCDGPRRRPGVDRLIPLKNKLFKNNIPVIFDDLWDIDEYCDKIVKCGTQKHPFVAGRYVGGSDEEQS